MTWIKFDTAHFLRFGYVVCSTKRHSHAHPDESLHCLGYNTTEK